MGNCIITSHTQKINEWDINWDKTYSINVSNNDEWDIISSTGSPTFNSGYGSGLILALTQDGLVYLHGTFTIKGAGNGNYFTAVYTTDASYAPGKYTKNIYMYDSSFSQNINNKNRAYLSCTEAQSYKVTLILQMDCSTNTTVFYIPPTIMKLRYGTNYIWE